MYGDEGSPLLCHPVGRLRSKKGRRQFEEMSFLFRWFDAILQVLGLKNKQARIIIVGLDNAGKSTLVHKLCTNEVRSFVPTIKAHSKTFTLGRIEFTAWDLGGHEQVS
jgi:GTP-binding protein SAR1